jgi:hypothetical protein
VFLLLLLSCVEVPTEDLSVHDSEDLLEDEADVEDDFDAYVEARNPKFPPRLLFETLLGCDPSLPPPPASP